VEAVAARAGVHKTTIYRRWPTKERLVAAALGAQAGGAIPIPDTGTVSGDLLQLARQVTANICSPVGGGLVRVLISESGHPGEIAQIASLFWRGRFDLAGEIVRRGVRAR